MKGRYPFQNKSQKNPGRRDRRSMQTLSLRKGYGAQSQYFWKKVAKRRVNKEHAKQNKQPSN